MAVSHHPRKRALRGFTSLRTRPADPQPARDSSPRRCQECGHAVAAHKLVALCYCCEDKGMVAVERPRYVPRRVVTDAERDYIVRLAEEGAYARDIARATDRAESTVRHVCAARGVPIRRSPRPQGVAIARVPPEAVRRARAGGESIESLARRLGVGTTTVKLFLRKAT